MVTGEAVPVTVISSQPFAYQMTIRPTGRPDQPRTLIFTDPTTRVELALPLTPDRVRWLHEATRPAASS